MANTYEVWPAFTEVPFVPGGLTALSNVTWQNQTGETISVLFDAYFNNVTVNGFSMSIWGYVTVNGNQVTPTHKYPSDSTFESAVISVPNNALVEFRVRQTLSGTRVVTVGVGVGSNITFLRLLPY